MRWIKRLLNGICLVFNIIDSAGFAALCDFLRECQKLNKTVRLVYPPKQLLTLADLVGLSDWIANFTDVN